jgi:outer membrane protein TolC
MKRSCGCAEILLTPLAPSVVIHRSDHDKCFGRPRWRCVLFNFDCFFWPRALPLQWPRDRSPPVYEKPATAAPPPTYKEVTDWQPAKPADAQSRGAWWSAYRDSQLDTLEAKVTDSNQNLKAAFARLQQARAQTRYVHASSLPTITSSADATRARTSANAPSYSPLKPATNSDLLLDIDLSYEVDVFSRVRNSIAAAHASEQASAADLAVVDLSMHSELAIDYFTLRSSDSQQMLFDKTVSEYTAV